MQITSITDIVGGELQNSPSISFIYNIKTNAKRVIAGDLFLAYNEEDLQTAIINGAFGIIYDFETSIIDKEIAWIKVNSVKSALEKLYRFKLANIDLQVYYCDNVTFNMLEVFKSSNKNIKLISSVLEDSTKIIENISDEDILFCSNAELLNRIYPNYCNFGVDNYELKNVMAHSLFETSFSYNDYYFSKLKISSLYIKNFLDVYNFLDQDIDLTRLKKFDNFKPIFVDKFLNIIEFGRSDKFILTQKEINTANCEIDYINKRYKYAKTLYLTKKYIKDLNEEQYLLENIENLKEFLKTKKFNCVYIIGYDFKQVEETLSKSNLNLSLL